MPHTLIARIAYAVYWAVCFFAMGKGTRWQKITGAVLLAFCLLTPIMQDRSNFMDPELRLLLLDCVALIYFLGIAMIIGRPWMILAASCQLLSILSHPAAHLTHGIGAQAYLSALQFYSAGPYLILGVSVALAVLREGRLGIPKLP